MPPVKKNRFTIIPEDNHTQGMRILSIEEDKNEKEEKKSKKIKSQHTKTTSSPYCRCGAHCRRCSCCWYCITCKKNQNHFYQTFKNQAIMPINFYQA